MKALVCKSCGATGLQVKNGYVTCEYCDTQFMLTAEDYDFYGTTKPASKQEKSTVSSSISLGSDIEMLLQKCRMNPKKAKKYANLILDIDPDNEDALKYL